LHPG